MALTSLWVDRHPRSTSAEEAEVAGDWDVVVIGAGLTGITTAGLLARAGLSVLVVEAEHLGAGTTGGSTAKLTLLQGTQLSKIAKRHSSAVLQHYVDANAEGQTWVARFCAEHGVALQERPAYTYANSTLGRRRIRAELEAARGAGLPVEWRDEVPLPFATRGAVRLEGQYQLDPMELLLALAADAQEHGVTLVEGARVQHVRGHDPAQVVTPRGTARARHVVVATNMPVLDRGGFFARAEPSRSYGLAFRTPVRAVDGMYLSGDTPSRSLRDLPSGDDSLLLVGGNGHKVGAATSEQARIDELRSWTAQYFPDAVETHVWSAQDYVPHHALPYAGPLLPGSDHLWVAGGYSKWGMTNAVAAALALSSRILGGSTPWAEAFQPWGAHEVTGLPTSARVNAVVGFSMVEGWVRPLVRPGAGAPPAEGEGRVRYDRVGPPTATSRDQGVERQVSGVCTHLGGVVRWNDAERSWDCPLHGSRFEADGSVLEGPATCGLNGLG